MQVVHARHEHCAVAMADGYARATGKVGVASTTCGPGFTQIMTALTIAARGQCAAGGLRRRFAAAASWYIQQIDMAPLALATGAAYVAGEALDRALDNVREAFHMAPRSSAARWCSACRWTCRSRPTRFMAGLHRPRPTGADAAAADARSGDRRPGRRR